MTTFVTALINLNEDRNYRPINTYVALFNKLASSGIMIYLYLDKSYSLLENEIPRNVIVEYIDLYELEIYKLINYKLPNKNVPKNRNAMKDTFNYMCLINSKIEFVYKAIKKNPFNTNHFAWIDFGICHVLKNIDETLQYLYFFSKNHKEQNILIMPTIWDKNLSFNNISSHESIIWRFPGGFFFGDKDSIINMYNLIIHYIPKFIDVYGIIAWEVNIWAWIEYMCLSLDDPWIFTTYYGNHDDSILMIPI